MEYEKQEREYYDPDKVGSLIAGGSDHYVHLYGQNEVIKFSVVGWVLGKDMALEKARYDYSACKKFFGDYVLETAFLHSPNNGNVAKVQRRVEGRQLRRTDLKNESVRRQFEEVVCASKALVSAGHAELDLIGQRGLLGNSLSNIFITPEKQLVILDTTLLELPGFVMFQPALRMLGVLVSLKQGQIIADYLNARA